MLTIAGGIILAIIVLCNLRFFLVVAGIGAVGFGVIMLAALTGAFN